MKRFLLPLVVVLLTITSSCSNDDSSDSQNQDFFAKVDGEKFYEDTRTITIDGEGDEMYAHIYVNNTEDEYFHFWLKADLAEGTYDVVNDVEDGILMSLYTEDNFHNTEGVLEIASNENGVIEGNFHFTATHSVFETERNVTEGNFSFDLNQ